MVCIINILKNKMAPWRGLEPPTLRLTAECSTIELLRNNNFFTRQRPALPQGLPCSTMGTVKLNLPVRNGKGCCLHVIATRYFYRKLLLTSHSFVKSFAAVLTYMSKLCSSLESFLELLAITNFLINCY